VVLVGLALAARVRVDLRHGLRVADIRINFRIRERLGNFQVVLDRSIRLALDL
jgi:hypothetical protein